MKSDIYTKIMLAVIALNLTVLTVINLLPSDAIDDTPQEVLIKGVSVNPSDYDKALDGDNLPYLPIRIEDQNTSLRVSVKNYEDFHTNSGPIEVDIKKVGGYDLGSYNWNMPSIPVEVRN